MREYWSNGFEDITPLIDHYSHLTIEAQRAGFKRFEQLERLERLERLELLKSMEVR